MWPPCRADPGHTRGADVSESPAVEGAEGHISGRGHEVRGRWNWAGGWGAVIGSRDGEASPPPPPCPARCPLTVLSMKLPRSHNGPNCLTAPLSVICSSASGVGVGRRVLEGAHCSHLRLSLFLLCHTVQWALMARLPLRAEFRVICEEG